MKTELKITEKEIKIKNEEAEITHNENAISASAPTIIIQESDK